MSIRFTIIYVSFALVLLVIVAFVAGPLWGLKLDYEKGQQMQLIQIAIPTFLSYFSAAITYATVGNVFPEPEGEQGKILRALSLGGMVLFIIIFVVATLVYYFSANGALQYGIDFRAYTNIITFTIGILGVTTSAVSTFIFAAKK